MVTISLILKDVLKEIEVPEENLIKIKKELKDFLKNLEENIKKKNISAEIFVGGSFAKETLIKKDYYDIDIFLRFDRKYSEKELSNLTKDILEKVGEFSIIHGSRDYFSFKVGEDVIFEVVPVKKIKTPKEAKNITDLSYLHVKYTKKRITNKKILDDIKLAKAFCYANKCYGAESYINGFSGYGLELLVYYYKGFLNFVKSMSNVNLKEKVVIDIEKQYKNKNQILMDINSAKLQSPLVLIDPTYPKRNVLAALSKNTLSKFKEVCKDFLSTPKKDFFELKRINFEKIKKEAKKKNLEVVLIELKTEKQSGDVAGSKLKKFYTHLCKEIGEMFKVVDCDFEYLGNKEARFFVVAKRKKEILIKGPFLNQKEHLKRFRKKYQGKKTFKILVKKNNIFVKYNPSMSLTNFVKDWEKRNKSKIKEMSIDTLKIVNSSGLK
ncbi:nucleotidyltransferase domain-containing protein [Patescibacteria group bacterium]|nr:nucleotidyltransferase domain-containing protein [Patescibacteria group bacterium]